MRPTATELELARALIAKVKATDPYGALKLAAAPRRCPVRRRRVAFLSAAAPGRTRWSWHSRASRSMSRFGIWPAAFASSPASRLRGFFSVALLLAILSCGEGAPLRLAALYSAALNFALARHACGAPHGRSLAAHRPLAFARGGPQTTLHSVVGP